MSFKREGNDFHLLSKLKRRRISELFAENIPKDEAKLLSNGRFTCTVCNSVPIFDTVNMLVVHRKGKKHLANQDIHESKMRELKQLIAVRKHQEFLKAGTTSAPVDATISGGVLLSSPYDPRVKRAKLRPTERKPRLDFQAVERTVSDPDAFRLDADSPEDSDLPGNSKPSMSKWRNLAEQQLSGPVMHDHQLKNLFASDKNSEGVKITPYQRKRKEEAKPVSCTVLAPSGKLPRHNEDSNHPSSSHSCSLSPHSLLRTNSITQKQDGELSTFGMKNPSAHTSSHKVKGQSNLPPPLPPPQRASHQHAHLQSKCLEKSPAQVLLSQKLRQLQGSGWKRDWDGKWIQDDNAEFDSDEEPPDIPLSL